MFRRLPLREPPLHLTTSFISPSPLLLTSTVACRFENFDVRWYLAGERLAMGLGLKEEEVQNKQFKQQLPSSWTGGIE